MPYILHFSQTTTAGEVLAALKRTPDTVCAAVFPSGQGCRIADEGEMATLSAYCSERTLAVTIIGGDASLRARAVAAHFVAATSLDEWDVLDEPEDVVAYGRRELALFTVLPELIADDTQGLYDPLHNDPPEYVRELQAAHATGELGDIAHVTRTLPSLIQHATEDAQAEALRRACERYEERITARIRRTSGLPGARTRPLPSITRPLDHEAQIGDFGIW